MNREELLDMLADLVRDGVISEEEAMSLRDAYDAGDIEAGDLPLPASEARPELSPAVAVGALLLLLAELFPGEGLRARARSLASGTREEISGEQVREAAAKAAEVLTRMPLSRRARAAQDALDRFSEEVSKLSGRHLFGEARNVQARNVQARNVQARNVQAWQRSVGELYRRTLLSLSALGQGRPLGGGDLRRLRAEAWDHDEHSLWAGTQRLAEEIAAREEAGRPMTRRHIDNRVRYGGGVIYGLFWNGAVKEQREGMIAWFEGVEDGRSCSGCVEAMAGNPYPALIGAVPIPGRQECGGNCRHYLRMEYAPQTYAALVGA